MRQMVFDYVFVQGWIIYPNVYSFLYQPHEVLILPPHYVQFFISFFSIVLIGFPLIEDLSETTHQTIR